MIKSVLELSPRLLWEYFSEIVNIPRPSKKEEKIIAWLLNFAKEKKLVAKKDEAGNVLIVKSAVKGMETLPVIVLQTHLDMVCEKNSDRNFDFLNDPIEVIVGDEWVSANGTTLGADDGIGIAAQLALLASSDIKHGALECLFTVDEETGLTGANALQPGFFTGRTLINLDSEDEGEIFIGCAGGIDTVATFTCTSQQIPSDGVAIAFKVSGLQGGHSGDDIHKGLGNANKILARFLHRAYQDHHIALADFDGGNLRNAIAREAQAVVVIPSKKEKTLLDDFKQFTSEINYEFNITEPGLVMTSETVPVPDKVIDDGTFSALLKALIACPHGVLEWSTRMPGMVETSTNLASVKFKGEQEIEVTTSQRSEIESRKQMAAGMVESVFSLAGASVIHSDGYPGWAPNTNSEILKTAVGCYYRLFNKEPVVRSIHAGLECGLFLEKYPGLDMISIGPTIKGAHSPGERINIKTVDKFWKHLVDILEHVS
jgi:dipeptidase D